MERFRRKLTISVRLQLIDIKKSYHNVDALNSVSLDLRGGKIIVLLGVNGAGKTTLMRIMAGLEKADSGELVLNDQSISCNALRFVSTLVFQKSASVQP